jgi:hypothetical protein
LRGKALSLAEASVRGMKEAAAMMRAVMATP